MGKTYRFCLITLLSICCLFAANSSEHNEVIRTPTVLLTAEEWPAITDDLDLAGMELAIQRQLVKFSRQQNGPQIKLGHIQYEFKVFQKSLEAFLNDVKETRQCLLVTNSKERCYQNFSLRLKEKYNLFAPTENGEMPETFFTAYHTPVIKTSLRKTADYKVGIHLKPAEPNLRSLTRNQINFENRLEGTAYEAMYMKDYFDQYLLHIQGGGKVIYRDASGNERSKYLNYDGTNSQPFRFISIYMRDQGYITNLSNDSQRNFLNENPHKVEEVYAYSPSYVFFKFTDEPPHGNDSVSLTDNRSVATDYRIYKAKGLITFVNAKRPVQTGSSQWKDFARFYIDHDTGGAIRGAARADLYFGEDDYAAFVASNLKVRGAMYFLALKPELL